MVRARPRRRHARRSASTNCDSREASARGSSRSACRRAGRQVGEDERLQRRDGFVADQPGAGGAIEMGALAGERGDEAGGEGRVGGGGQPVVVADPGDHRSANTLRCQRRGRPARFALDPVVDQSHGERGAGRIAAIAQVAQPAEAVQGIEPQRAPRPRAATADRRIGCTAPRRRVSLAQQAGCSPDRPARYRAPRRRSFWACRSPGSGNKGGRRAASGRICRSRWELPWSARPGTERMGRAPAVKGSPGRRISEATSVIFSVLFGPVGISAGRSRGFEFNRPGWPWRCLKEAPARPQTPAP